MDGDAKRDCADLSVDDILITEDGYENLTTAPKGVGDMERIVNESV